MVNELTHENRGQQVMRVVRGVTCSGYEFHVSGQWGGVALLTVQSKRPCSASGGLPNLQTGRPWYISRSFTEAQIYNTCLMAVLAFEEHEIRENFKVNGKALYAPAH